MWSVNNKTIEIFFFKNRAENKAGKLIPQLAFFEKALYEVNPKGLQLGFNIL